MLFSYSWLQSFFEKKLPEPEVLADLIIRHSFEVERIEKKGKDTVFAITILSNRPDCFSHIGIAREIGAILGLKLILPKTKAANAKNAAAAKTLVDVKIENPEACRRYTAMVVGGVKVGPSPAWMKERLEACGLRAINSVVDSANYAMLETGQPLHTFDWDKLQNLQSKARAKKIIVRFAQNGETIDALNEKKYSLDSKMLVIADETGPLVVAGIKGGKRAEISAKTATVVVESANFDRRAIRATSRKLGLQTDASLLYEHDLDPSQTAGVARRAAELIAQTSGGRVLTGAVDRYPAPVKEKRIVLDMESAESLLGVSIQTARAKKILELLGFSVRKGKGLTVDVAAPTRRTDVSIAQDLVEEIGRISGYDSIAPELPAAAILPAAKNYFWFWKNRAKDALAAAGWTETRNYTFISADDCRNFNIKENSILEIKNPVNADLRFMRPSLLPVLLKNAAANSHSDDLRQFEIGRIFAPDLRIEPTMVAGFDKGGTFFEVKGMLEFVCKRLGVADFRTAPLGEGIDSLFDAANSARIFAKGKEIGIAGSVSPTLCATLGLKPLIAFELSMDVLSVVATQKNDYKPISTQPVAIRDLAVLAPKREYSEAISKVIVQSGGILVKAVEPIDVYEGKNIPQDRKNIVFRIAYQAKDRTLSGKEIDGLQAATIKALEERGWQVRKS